MAAERETKLYELDVERRRQKSGGGYEPFWKVKSVADTLADEDQKFRCKDCGGAVKVFKSTKLGAHAEHLVREDSEYCVAGLHFQKATDGRQPRASANPVQ